jgi:hypothetical protein
MSIGGEGASEPAKGPQDSMHYRGVRGEPMVAIGSIVLVFEDSDISLTAILRASANSARVNWRPADVVAFDSRQA